MCVFEERGDSAKAFATTAPSVQKYQMARRRISDHLIDQAGSVVLEALDAGDSTSQGEGRSVSREYTGPEGASSLSLSRESARAASRSDVFVSGHGMPTDYRPAQMALETIDHTATLFGEIAMGQVDECASKVGCVSLQPQAADRSIRGDCAKRRDVCDNRGDSTCARLEERVAGTLMRAPEHE